MFIILRLLQIILRSVVFVFFKNPFWRFLPVEQILVLLREEQAANASEGGHPSGHPQDGDLRLSRRRHPITEKKKTTEAAFYFVLNERAWGMEPGGGDSVLFQRVQ